MTTNCDDEVRILAAVARWHDGVLSSTELLEVLGEMAEKEVRVVVKRAALGQVILWSVFVTILVELMFKADSRAVVSPKVDLLFNVVSASIGIVIIYRRSRELLK